MSRANKQCKSRHAGGSSGTGKTLPRKGTDADRWGRFLLCVTGVVLLWGIVLPAIAKLPHVHRKIVREQALGIDPSAMFYTELDSKPLNMDDYRRLHEQRQAETEERSGRDRSRSLREHESE